jgi:hypothetical protein
VEKAREVVAALEKQIADLKKKKPKDLAEQPKPSPGQDRPVKKATPHYDMPMANAVEEAALFVVEADNKKGTKLDYKHGHGPRSGTAEARQPQRRGAMHRAAPFPLGLSARRRPPRAFTHRQRQLELAQAIVEEAAPLTARVIVNRVWKHHFGRGLVDTPSEFGNLGEAPSHPELLDDLAARFIENGWSFKWLHREILNSATWRQSSLAAESEAAIRTTSFTPA